MRPTRMRRPSRAGAAAAPRASRGRATCACALVAASTAACADAPVVAPAPEGPPPPAAAMPSAAAATVSSEPTAGPAPAAGADGGAHDDPRPVAKLAFAGDVAVALHVGHFVAARARGERVPPEVSAGYPFTHVRDRIRAADLSIGNLECVVSRKGSVSTDHNPLRAPLEALEIVAEAGFDVVSVANNHAYDFGPSAFSDMLARVEAQGLVPIGAHVFEPTRPPFLVREVSGVRVALVATYGRERPAVVSDVRAARAAADVVVVFPHWGADDDPEPTPAQRRLARAVIDAGADLVIGTHAHVLQPEEWYRGKLVFYGLGNFVFSGMGIDDAHQTGGYLEVDLDRRGLVERRFYRVRLDRLGAPHWLDLAPTDPPRLGSASSPVARDPRAR